MQLSAIVKLLRPQQWIKNVFVLLPVFFGQRINECAALVQALLCAVLFSLAASAVYCLNDIVDREADAQHPTKCRRPIASGAITVPVGWAVCLVCATISLGAAAWLLPSSVLVLMASYLALNIAYSTWLKHYGLVDVLVVAVFYVMRVEAGALATGIEVSQWLVAMTFLLALFLVLGKRRDDVLLQSQSDTVVRRGAAYYNLEFINVALGTIATVAIVSYMMYTMSNEVISRFGNDNIYLTTVFVIAGMLRYMQLALVEHKTGSPTSVLLHDRFVQVCVLGWVASFVVIIYLY